MRLPNQSQTLVVRQNSDLPSKQADEGERGHGKEIHRSDGFPMIAQKRRPSPCRI